jgi:hypothetical protein
MRLIQNISVEFMINLLLRLVLLAIIIYVVLSYVPVTPLDNDVKLIITILVVITYSIMDIMGVSLSTTKNLVCDLLC